MVRIFAWLARRLLPDDLVEVYGEAQVKAFRDALAEARASGVWAVGRLWWREVAGLVSVGREARRGGKAESVWVRALGETMRDGTKDLILAGRTLRNAPGYTLTVVVILAVGVAAIAGAFTVANGVLFRPLPFRDADRLALIWTELDQSTTPSPMTVSPADFIDFASGVATFSDMAAHNLWFPVVSGGAGDAQSILAGLVTPRFFSLLGVEAALGRTFLAEEGDGAHRVVVLSDGLWRSRYGGDPRVVGTDVRLNGLPYEVVGVLPADYKHPDPHRPLEETQLFVPFDVSPWPDNTGRFLRVFGRLAPGVPLDRARAELEGIAASIARDRPVVSRDTGVILRDMREEFYASSRPALYLALAGAALLFAIVCANVANLVLARSLARRREFAVRASLGAGKGRIARQILLENGVLALAGCALGVVAVVALMDVIQGLQGRVLPLLGDIRLDARVLLFTAFTVALTTLFLGVLPLGEFFRTPVRTVLTEESGGTGGSRRSQRIRAGLVVGEIAVAAALVVGAGLLSSSFRKLASVGPGFDAPRVLTVELTAPRDRYPGGEDFVPLYQEMGVRLSSVPGAEVVAYASQLPLLDGNWTREFDVVDQPRDESQWPTTEMRMVSPGYFRAMGIPLRAGREFTDLDGREAPRVVIVNETLASRHWPGANALGRMVRWRQGDEVVAAEVVGVVGDVLDDGLGAQPDPFTYYPFAQSPNRSAGFAVRTSGDVASLIPSVRQAIRDVDPQLPVDLIAPYQERIMETVAAPRLASSLARVFSALALAVAGLGIYGVVAYTVTSRTREIGIRAALGAGRSEVAGLVVRQGLVLASMGAVLGIGLALVSGRVLSALLYDTSAQDPIALLSAPVVLVGVALLASYLPVRRALNVDPVKALRSDGR